MNFREQKLKCSHRGNHRRLRAKATDCFVKAAIAQRALNR
jgi:hypothetical protein